MKKPLTNQQIINRVARHLFKQRVPAIGISGCMYRTHDDLRCAVGCLIPKKDYRVTFEGKSVRFVLRELSVRERFAQCSKYLLQKLQTLHDDARHERSEMVCEFWADGLRNLANDLGLKVPPAVIKEEKGAAA